MSGIERPDGPGVAAVWLLLLLSGCGPPDRETVAARGDGVPGPGTSAVEQGAVELAAAGGQTIYVPAYSAVATADNSQLYQLAITLSVRNTDRSLPIIVTAIRYHHQDGRLVREYLKAPLRIAPLAALEVYVRECDTSGGTASSFLVDWLGDPAASHPMVESVMVGTTGNQGISFTCPGRVVANRSTSSETPLPSASPARPAAQE
jgi:hypothetical protein